MTALLQTISEVGDSFFIDVILAGKEEARNWFNLAMQMKVGKCSKQEVLPNVNAEPFHLLVTQALHHAVQSFLTDLV